MDDDQKPHVGPPDLILQAIVPPTDAPTEIRAAVADTLARLDLPGERVYTWEDIGFAASAIALVEGTNQRAQPDTQWVFALSADSPKLGEQVQSEGSWASAPQSHSYSNGPGRLLWRVSVFDALRTVPRPRPEAPAA
jgi:hypothetical protein